ncbi:MAG: tetratricopeptide repeat protein [Pseudomonas sp.]|nr:tetratricopeptide repeat protein [Pseudomonas sp.]
MVDRDNPTGPPPTVHGAPPRWRASLRRFAWPALCALLGVAVLALGLAYVDAARGRARAEASAAQRQAALRFVADDILRQADPYSRAAGKRDPSVREAVDRAAASVDRRAGGDPAAAAAIHALVADVYFGHDDHAAAIDHYRRALALYRTVRPTQDETLVRVETSLCDVLRIAARLVEAEAACMGALRRAQATGSGAALATLKLGQLRGEQGRYRQSQALLRPLLADRALLADPKTRGELHWALGLAARALGQYPQAREHFEALADVARRLGPDSTWAGWAYNSLGSVLVETGDYDRADAMLVRARRAFARAQGPNQIETYMPEAWRAEIRLQRAQWDDAIAMLRAILAGWGDKLAADHPLRLRIDANLAWALAMRGDRQAAGGMLDATLGNGAVPLDRGDDRTAPYRTLRWARTALALDRLAQADQLLRSFGDAAVQLPDPHPLRAEATCLRARWLDARGDGDAARRASRTCVQQLALYFPASHPLRREAAAL